MKVILDTHAFLWWITDDRRLSSGARQAIANPGNELLLSVASAWEIAIKTRLGRLSLPESADRFIPDQLSRNGISSLPIQVRHALYTARLPPIHRDPFDRLIIAQCVLEKVPIVTRDKVIPTYKVDTIW
jgi:PIN domain nuclease of toxin-antitoxin system